MSYYLEQLIGPERRAACLANDAAFAPQPKEQAMRHPVHVGRMFADKERSSSEPEMLGGQEYEFTEIHVGQPMRRHLLRFPSASEANSHALALQASGCVVVYGPAASIGGHLQ